MSRYLVRAADVKKLRAETGALLMDCKSALQANKGDMEKAKEWLRSLGTGGRTRTNYLEGRVAELEHRLDGAERALVEMNGRLIALEQGLDE